MSAYASMRERRSYSKVGTEAPGLDELLRLVEAAGTLADHSALHPWRLIALRGASRDLVGHALADADAATYDDREKFVAKAQRAPLLIAIVSIHRPSEKVPGWEQEAVASGVAHALSLLLDEAGWGVMWRTGHHTRSEPVRAAHRLLPNENLLGWLYVGDRPGGTREQRRSTIAASDHLTELG